MAQLLTTLTLTLALGVGLGPDDADGMGDARVEVEPGARQVSIELERFEALRERAELEVQPEPGPRPWAAQRDVVLERRADGIRIRAVWQLQTVSEGWWWGPLIGPLPGLRVESASWKGRELGVMHTPAGEEVAVKMAAESRGELKIVVFVPADRLPAGVDGGLELQLLPAVRGAVRLRGTPAPAGRVAQILVDGQPRPAIDGRFWAGEGQLRLAWTDAQLAPGDDDAQAPLAVAHTAVGLTFGDGELRGRARVSWLVRRGQLDRLSLDTAGLGRDLELSGPNLREWRRQGDRIEIELEQPVSGRVDVELRWTQGVPGGAEATLASPRITPEQVYRSEDFMQIARDGELEVLPKLEGWAAVARAELPEWAGGYIEGTATASFRREGNARGGSFELLRFVPVSGPPVVVDIAAYEIATSDEGRSLVQARYDVRNERASHLRVELPPNSRMLGVRVNGETVTPALDAGSRDAWRIPIVRSLESVTGTLSFPVEVIFISEAEQWDKKEVRELQLPALDAPVAVSRVRVYLPPRYDNRVDVGEFHRVADFSEGDGITYGLGVGAGSAELSRADELYRGALSSWMANDFKAAQSSLDELQQLGASNANIDGLQANLDLVQGVDGSGDAAGGGQSAVVSRRIKEQARMRAVEEEIVLQEKAKQATKLEAKGDYAQAEELLAEAQEIGDRLAMLEQSESKEQQVYNQALSSSSARVAEKKKKKAKRESVASADKRDKRSKNARKPPEEAERSREREQVYAFEDDLVDGDLLVPTGGAIVDTGVLDPDSPQPVTQTATVTTTAELYSETEQLEVTMDDARQLPVGNSTRDFTAVIDIQPEPPPSPLAQPEPEPEPESEPMLDLAVDDFEAPLMAADSPARKSRGGRGRGRGGGRGKGKRANAPSPPTDAPSTTTAAPAGAMIADPNAALAGPVVSASAVSIHVPAVGEAVMYQHMLLPVGETLKVHLEARRHKQSKSK